MAKKTSIGGMALLEGIMMIGPEKKSVAVRKPDGEIDITTETLAHNKKIRKIPLVRGVYGIFTQMVYGIKSLMHAASLVDIEEEGDKEPSKFENWMEKKFGDKAFNIIIYFSVAFALLFSVGLFILLPNLLAGLVSTGNVFLNNLIEGVLRIGIFFTYIVLVSRMKDIRRVWMYHGAEHKTISCYENDEELTVENARKYTTKHKRCGTSFLFIVLIVSVLIFSFTGWNSMLLNLVIRLLLIPVVAGISYEIIKIAGASDGLFSRIASAPGLFFQRFTTKEPDDEMLEVAIAAFKAVIPEEEGSDKW
ncbi:MAG TPA: DUF1385 domain-containing protein [Clostridia bacterium]|jgi:uncharacterized protein YqhQ|nr:DUF1385 domain-containing protein [Clostridia bacterium]HPQ47112.1 DUF1385 domain-containing protein [Clostridia bacterium]